MKTVGTQKSVVEIIIEYYSFYPLWSLQMQRQMRLADKWLIYWHLSKSGTNFHAESSVSNPILETTTWSCLDSERGIRFSRKSNFWSSIEAFFYLYVFH